MEWTSNCNAGYRKRCSFPPSFSPSDQCCLCLLFLKNLSWDKETTVREKRGYFFHMLCYRATLSRNKTETTLAVFILETCNLSGRASAKSLLFVWLCVYSIKTSTRRATHLDELLFEMRLGRRITKGSSSSRIMLLVPVFIL